MKLYVWAFGYGAFKCELPWWNEAKGVCGQVKKVVKQFAMIPLVQLNLPVTEETRCEVHCRSKRPKEEHKRLGKKQKRRMGSR